MYTQQTCYRRSIYEYFWLESIPDNRQCLSFFRCFHSWNRIKQRKNQTQPIFTRVYSSQNLHCLSLFTNFITLHSDIQHFYTTDTKNLKWPVVSLCLFYKSQSIFSQSPRMKWFLELKKTVGKIWLLSILLLLWGQDLRPFWLISELFLKWIEEMGEYLGPEAKAAKICWIFMSSVLVFFFFFFLLTVFVFTV